MIESGASDDRGKSYLQMDALRWESLGTLLVLATAAGWLGLQVGYTVAPMSPHMWLGILTIFGGVYSAYVLARRSFRLGSIWLVTVLTLALSLMILAFPDSSLRFFSALIPLAGTLILSPPDTWISLALVLISLLGIETLVPHAAVGYVAHVIWTQGVARCDYVIDFHANEPGGTEFMCATPCDDRETLRRTLEMAEVFGFPLVQIRRDEWAYDRSLIACAQDAGKPAILPEPLCQGVLDAASIAAAIRGTHNVIKMLGMVDGQIEPQTDIKVSGGHFRFVNPTSIVNAGQIVGTLLEPHTRQELWGV